MEVDVAYYEYKQARDAMPESVLTTEYYRAVVCNCDGSCKRPCEYQGDPNYDGDMWTVTAEYINRLTTVARGFLAEQSDANADALRAALNGEIPAIQKHD